MTQDFPPQGDLDATCAVLSRAARQRLLAMPPRQRVLTLLNQPSQGWHGHRCMFARDLDAVLASFDGEGVLRPPALEGMGLYLGEMLEPDRDGDLDAWLSQKPDLDAELMHLAAQMYAAAKHLDFPSEETLARFAADSDQVVAWREEAAAHIAAIRTGTEADQGQGRHEHPAAMDGPSSMVDRPDGSLPTAGG